VGLLDPTIANLGYALTFGSHDPTVLYRSLIALIGLPVLLLHIPAFFADRIHDETVHNVDTRHRPLRPVNPADPGEPGGEGAVTVDGVVRVGTAG
jgi:hypothetical protein